MYRTRGKAVTGGAPFAVPVIPDELRAWRKALQGRCVSVSMDGSVTLIEAKPGAVPKLYKSTGAAIRAVTKAKTT